MNTDPARMDALHRFVAGALGRDDFRIEVASADASFRRYWRVRFARASGPNPGAGRAESRIVMDAPPGLEDVQPWLDIGARLARAGLHVPAVLARDIAQGFLLIEDFGARTLLPELTPANAQAHYAQALDAIVVMQRDASCDGLPAFDAAWATQEMELMPTWFLRRHLGLEPGCDGWDAIELAFTRILAALAGQPQRFMHRDFHSRNLMVVSERNPGIIDFQGAMRGPIAYDAASLLRDCYIEWPRQHVAQWVEDFRRRLVAAGITDADEEPFRRWFDLTGLQRHIKVLGIFCRLYYRDGKAQYLGDLPLVLRYVLDVARDYPEFADFVALLVRATQGRDVTRPREDGGA